LANRAVSSSSGVLGPGSIRSRAFSLSVIACFYG
jgi:hypothetical protein